MARFRPIRVGFKVTGSMDVPETIPCVDCGCKAHRLTPEPEVGFEPGDWVAYRCSGCGDRWDMEVSEGEG